jgi:hypothetical protein
VARRERCYIYSRPALWSREINASCWVGKMRAQCKSAIAATAGRRSLPTQGIRSTVRRNAALKRPGPPYASRESHRNALSAERRLSPIRATNIAVVLASAPIGFLPPHAQTRIGGKERVRAVAGLSRGLGLRHVIAAPSAAVQPNGPRDAARVAARSSRASPISNTAGSLVRLRQRERGRDVSPSPAQPAAKTQETAAVAGARRSAAR